MNLTIVVLIVAAALVALYVVWSRRQQRRFERSMQEPLCGRLDSWIAEVEHPDVPIVDVHRYDRRGGEGFPIEAGFFAYLNSVRFIDVACRYRRGRMEYSIKYGTQPALEMGRFPPYDAPSCYQPWFVQRMAKLFALLDAYPRERLRSVQAQRVHEREMAEIDALNAETEALLEACKELVPEGGTS